MSNQDYFNQVYRDAREIGCNHIQATLCATQSSMETGWGKHVKGNSYFGIKAGSSWHGETVTFTTHEVVNGRRVKIQDKFRKYANQQDSIRDYSDTMARKWPNAWNASNFEDAARGLLTGVHGAYATDPSYVNGVLATGRKRGPIALKAYDGNEVAPAEPKTRPANLAKKGRPQQPADVTRQVIKQHMHLVPESYRNQKVFLLAVRGYYLDSKGKRDVNDRGIYDDALFIVSQRGVWSFNANVDPSAYRRSIASYRSNQAISFKQGIHGYSKPAHRRYKAFEQVSEAVVDRDQVGEDRGDFSMNIHRGSSKGNTSSAGCITVPYGPQWNEFFKQACEEMDAEGEKLIWLILLEYQGGHPPLSVNGDAEDDDDEFDLEMIPVGLNPDPEPVESDNLGARLMDRLESLTERLKPRVNEEGSTTVTNNQNDDDNSLLLLLASSALSGKELDSKAITELLTKRLAGERGSAGGPSVDKDLKALLLRTLIERTAAAAGGEKTGPVTNALGKTIGGLLNGKKTAIGVIGTLVTQIFGSAEEGSMLAELVEKGLPLLAGTGGTFSPIFIIIMLWGALSKVEKWNLNPKG